MNNQNTVLKGELVDDVSEFFAPVSSDLIDVLVGEYDGASARITALAYAVRQEQYAGTLHYFIEGNTPDQRHGLPTTVEALFSVEGAIGQLRAEYWNRALRMTDVIDYMPQARRDEWFEQISHPLGKKADKHSKEYTLPPLPDFTEETVRATLGTLMASRAKFFSERVDGIFQSLSREHVTNRPEGFGKRFIIPHVINSFGTIEHRQSGVINDLRCVIAKFMGRDEPKYGATDAVIRAARQHNGQWTAVDGNAFRIRIYNGVGTAHIEVHPEMAWRLNAVLASMYPQAIPAQFREKPKRQRKIKDFELFERPLPFAVINELASMREGHEPVKEVRFNQPKYRALPKTRQFSFRDHDKYARAEAENVIRMIGGVWDAEARHWVFEYDPAEVLQEIICSGCIPDHKSHQYYPTPADLAEIAVDLAKIDAELDMTWLEPSAGTGGLADLMPESLCIEISALHCEILKAKGHRVERADFLKWSTADRFDRIVMNPPFSEGRWQAHIEHAASLLSSAGKLVAIIPASANGKDVLPGFDCEWHGPYDNKFPGASVSVVILVATPR